MALSTISCLLPEKLHILLVTVCVFSVLNDLTVLADPPYWYCPDANNNSTAANSIFGTNVKSLLLSLSSNASESNSYNMSLGNGNNTAYGLYLCYKFVSPEACRSSIIMATQALTTLCPDSTDAAVWEDLSQLRISNLRFFGKLDMEGDINKYNTKLAPEPWEFRSVVNNSLYDLAQKAAFNTSGDMYATQSVSFLDSHKIYSLVQCTPDLLASDCYRCLQKAIGEVLSSNNYQYRGGRLLSKSCYLRYELYAFYEGKTSEDQKDQNNQLKEWVILVVAIGSLCLLVVLVASSLLYFVKRNRTLDFRGKDSQLFDLATLHAATDNFCDASMLGEGGFGPVFKGTLQDGTKVAVKRLSISSDQGVEEFKNEVLLIMKLQHRNLVRLLGFCVEGAERLLIYELMPNGGLDSILYEQKNRAELTWTKRLEIINGIARGVLYLHEESRVKIIHRDLKPSNVLLDSELNPKISDFGNARMYGSEIEASTAIVIGTYGYMAPEYAMEGMYSTKSDVYSFGIILLEILTGRKSPGFHLSGNGPSLQAYVWKLWSKGRGKELMDPLLKSTDSCNADEFLRCLHIGLLCVQEDASERPTMSWIIRMLTTEGVHLDPPRQPAFCVGRFGDHYEASPRLSTSLQCFVLSELTGR